MKNSIVNLTTSMSVTKPLLKMGLSVCSALVLVLTVGCGSNADSQTESTVDHSVVEEEVTETNSVDESQEEANMDSETETAENDDAPEAQAQETAEVSSDSKSTEKTPLAADAGKQIYQAHCSQCHAAGLLSSPKFGDKEAWASRIAKGKETLYKHSAQGYNSMPPQAEGDVTVEQVHAAVDYMIEEAS